MTTTSRMHWWVTLALAGVAGLLLGVLTGPRKSLSVSPRAREDRNVLRIAYSQDLQADPHRRTFPLSVHNQFVLALWEPLIECDPETGQPLPAAAESWEWSDDRLTLTLKLRPDGRWSNGDRVTAADFVRGWRRLLQSRDGAGALQPLKNAAELISGKAKDPGQLGVEALDELTLRIALAGVRSTWVTEMADPLLSPLHASTEEALRDCAYQHDPARLVTNGAFALESATAEGFRLKVSPHYRDRAHVPLRGAHFLRADGPRMAQLMIAAGQADVTGLVFGPGPVELPTNRCVTEETELALTVVTLDLNVTRGPLQDLRVRRALALALNRAGPVEKEQSENMVPAYSWVPDMPGRPGLSLLREDAAEARRLLAEAGYPGGRGFPVLIMPISPRWRQISYLEAWTEQWYRELGVRTYIAIESDDDRARNMRAGNHDIYYNGLLATVPDAGDMLSTFALPGVFNGSHWRNEEVERLLMEADRKTGSERLALLERVERIAMEAVPTIPMMFERRRTLLSIEVEGWYADPLGRQALKRLSLRSLPGEKPVPVAL